MKGEHPAHFHLIFLHSFRALRLHLTDPNVLSFFSAGSEPLRTTPLAAPAAP